jgi:predicted RNA polymerase sigma factor
LTRSPGRFNSGLGQLDRVEDARAAADRALELVYSDAERRFLERRLAEL